jgi:hypothetical protein
MKEEEKRVKGLKREGSRVSLPSGAGKREAPD